MDYQALRAAILADPACAALAVLLEHGKVPGGAHAQDAQIAQIMRAAGWGASSRAVPTHLAKKLLIKRMRWLGIKRAAVDDTHPAQAAAFAAVELAEDARMDADFGDPSAAGLMAPLLQAGLLTADDVDALRTMCRGESTVSAADVSRALRGPWE